MKIKTLKDWNARNRRIQKGSKAVGFDDKGNALFSKKQTRKIDVYMYEGSGTNYNQDNYYFGGDNPDQMDYDLGLCGQI